MAGSSPAMTSSVRATGASSQQLHRIAAGGADLEDAVFRHAGGMLFQRKRPAIRRPLSGIIIGRSWSDRGSNPLLQLLLRRGADLARSHLAALEDHQRRDRHHAVFRGRLRALVDVELDDLDLVAHRAGNLVERGRDHAAGAAPFGPEIDHDRPGRLEHFGVEIGVRNLANGHWNTSFSSGRMRLKESPPGSCSQPMNAALPGQAWTSPRIMVASCASSARAEISINSGLSVQSNAA